MENFSRKLLGFVEIVAMIIAILAVLGINTGDVESTNTDAFALPSSSFIFFMIAAIIIVFLIAFLITLGFGKNLKNLGNKIDNKINLDEDSKNEDNLNSNEDNLNLDNK